MWKLNHQEDWALKNWYFQTVVLEKTLESPLDFLSSCGIGEDSWEGPLDFKEIQPVNPKRNQPWIFIGRTDAEAEALVLGPPDMKSQLIGKDPDAGKDWGQEEKGAAEGEMDR